MIAFLGAGIVLGLSAGFSPGPLFSLVISQASRYGTKEGIKVALAPLVTDFPIIAVTTAVVMWVAHFRALLGFISLAGGLFVLYLAYENFRAGGRGAKGASTAPRSLLRGIAVNLLSPHPYLFWLTVGVPAMLKAWAESPLTSVAFVGGFYACLVGAKALLALLAGRARRFISGKPYRYLMYVLGSSLVLFAFLLFREGLLLMGVLSP